MRYQHWYFNTEILTVRYYQWDINSEHNLQLAWNWHLLTFPIDKSGWKIGPGYPNAMIAGRHILTFQHIMIRVFIVVCLYIDIIFSYLTTFAMAQHVIDSQNLEPLWFLTMLQLACQLLDVNLYLNRYNILVHYLSQTAVMKFGR